MDELIQKSLNPKGRLDCGTCFKIAQKLGIKVIEVANRATALNIKIDSCELGQFGRLKVSKPNLELLSKIKPKLDEKGRIFCEDARNVAKGVGLKNIRSLLKSEKIDVKYCLLGCFKEKKGKKMQIKTKIWIENSKGELLFGKGKTEVLELVDKTGSISKASEELGMNYKKAWTHLQILQKNISKDFVQTKQGGGETAGTTLAPEAYEMIQKYKTLKKDIEDFADKRFAELFLKKD